MKGLTRVFAIFGTSITVLVMYLIFGSMVFHSTDLAFAQTSSLTIITLSNDNKLLGNGKFAISPNPFTNTGNYTVYDNSSDDSEKDKDGITTLSGIKNGNYTIMQIGTVSGYSVDRIQKTVSVKNSAGIATFTDTSSSSSITSDSGRSITYTAKFECGSIYAGEGPLRPGHYDTDISLFNKQKIQTQILWNSVISDGPTSNAVLVKMDSEAAKRITCQDIRSTLGNYNDNFIEGFTIISVPLDSSFNSGATLSSPMSSDINILDVQVFYTANALDSLPHEVIVDKISFYVIQDYTGKIPKDLIRKTMDISIPSSLNEISDTEMKVKKAMQRQYNLTDDDLGNVVIRIKDVSVGVGVLIDDHAISLSTVKPQLSS